MPGPESTHCLAEDEARKMQEIQAPEPAKPHHPRVFWVVQQEGPQEVGADFVDLLSCGGEDATEAGSLLGFPQPLAFVRLFAPDQDRLREVPNVLLEGGPCSHDRFPERFSHIVVHSLSFLNIP